MLAPEGVSPALALPSRAVTWFVTALLVLPAQGGPIVAVHTKSTLWLLRSMGLWQPLGSAGTPELTARGADHLNPTAASNPVPRWQIDSGAQKRSGRPGGSGAAGSHFGWTTLANMAIILKITESVTLRGCHFA